MSCIYGPNQVLSFSEQGWASWFSLATLKGWPLTIYGDGDQVRDMLYAEDCVHAYDAFLNSNVKHGVWNLGGGTQNTITLNQHLELMERITGKRSEVKHEDWRPADQKCYVSNISPIKKALGWEPKVSPEEGLIKVTEFFKNNLEIFGQ
jgi:CDP-paratose 2-epimerase